jgi:hypothetical protein
LRTDQDAVVAPEVEESESQQGRLRSGAHIKTH